MILPNILEVIDGYRGFMNSWWFPKKGSRVACENHPFLEIFPEINHPSGMVPPFIPISDTGDFINWWDKFG